MNYLLKKKKPWGAQGAIISGTGDGFGKKCQAVQEVLLALYILYDVEVFQGHDPPTDVINFLCQTVNEAVLSFH